MIRLGWDNARGQGRILRDQTTAALELEDGLTTAALLTVFTWAPATDEEIRAAGLEEQQGWWGDAETVRGEGEQIVGSKLWLLSKRGTTLANLRRAEEITKAAFAWWIDEGLARAVEVRAVRVRPGVLGLEITIEKPDLTSSKVKFAWEMTTDAI